MTQIKKDSFQLKPYTPKELRQLYGVSPWTFQKWIKPFKEMIGEPIGRMYNVHQVKAIIEQLGFPETLEY